MLADYRFPRFMIASYTPIIQLRLHLFDALFDVFVCYHGRYETAYCEGEVKNWTHIMTAWVRIIFNETELYIFIIASEMWLYIIVRLVYIT